MSERSERERDIQMEEKSRVREANEKKNEERNQVGKTCGVEGVSEL